MRASSPAPARRRFRGRSPDERQAERRDRLLDAGLETFGTSGFHAVGVREICAEAKLTERYFYESFRNREALFLAVYERAVSRVRGAVDEALASAPPDPSGFARTGLRATLLTFRGDPRLARIVLIEVLTVGAELGEASISTSHSFSEQISDFADRLHPDLPERGLDSRLVANGLYGATLYLTMRWALEGFREPVERILDACMLFYDALGAKALRPTKGPPRAPSSLRRKKPKRRRAPAVDD